MIFDTGFSRSIVIGALGFAALLPAAVAAQEIPSYATPAYASADETIHGRIRSVDGAFTISVDDDRGFVDRVTLHPGTIINPTGLSLSAGMSVTILGANAGSTFDANEIDTPYSYAGPLPTPVYLGPGYWCPGFAYGYGPSFSLAFVFGEGYGHHWHYDHHPFYGRPWNGQAYFGALVGSAGRDDRSDRGGREGGIHTEPAARRAPADMHAPTAFQGRSFAGESRSFAGESRSFAGESRRAAAGGNAYREESSPQVFSSAQTGQSAAVHAAPGGSDYERTWSTRGGDERMTAPQRMPAPRAGFEAGETSRNAPSQAGGFSHGGGNGSTRGPAAGSHGGGGHAH